MDKETEKQALEAFEETIVRPLGGRYDEKQRAQDFAMFSLGFHRGRASGQQGVEVVATLKEIDAILVNVESACVNSTKPVYNNSWAWEAAGKARKKIEELIAASPQITSPAEKQEGTPK